MADTVMAGTEIGRVICCADTSMSFSNGTITFRRGTVLSVRATSVYYRRPGNRSFRPLIRQLSGLDGAAWLARRLAARTRTTNEPIWQAGDKLPRRTRGSSDPHDRNVPTTPEPSLEELRAMTINESMHPWAIDGCENIEPDGQCEHGCPAWPRYLGLV